MGPVTGRIVPRPRRFCPVGDVARAIVAMHKADPTLSDGDIAIALKVARSHVHATLDRPARDFK